VHAERQIEAQLSLALRPRRAGLVSIVALCLIAIFAWHWETFYSMATTWWRTETFAHGLLVLPIFGYLVWRDRDRLDAVVMRPCAPALIGLALAGFVWMLGDLSATIGVSQFAMVAMVPFAVCAVLGVAAARALAFPLAFLFFAVPFGGFMLPWLMQMTADFTVAAVRLSGVPVYREGMMFFLPSGAWSVVEACSGLRYLIASVMVGTLYAYLTYRSPRRRMLFVGVSIVVPLIANWLRAYLIVMLGHLSDNRLATGVDHLIYGWIFFGLVMLIMFWIGAKWREDLDDTPPIRKPAPVVEAGRSASRYGAAVIIAAAVLIGLWKPAAYALNAPTEQGSLALQSLASTATWTAAERPSIEWVPALDEPSAALYQAFQKGDAEVALLVAYYRDQTEQSEAVSGEGDLVESADRQWRLISTQRIPLAVGADSVSAVRTELVHPHERVVAWRWYWVGGHMTANAYAAKAYLAWAKLMRQGDDSAAIVLYTRKRDTSDPADRRLADFLAEMSPQLVATLQSAHAQTP
jgi:exosortase A